MKAQIFDIGEDRRFKRVGSPHHIGALADAVLDEFPCFISPLMSLT
jgi:hypothetical protein